LESSVLFIGFGLIGGITYFNSVGGFSTGEGRSGCLMSIIFTIGVFYLVLSWFALKQNRKRYTKNTINYHK